VYRKPKDVVADTVCTIHVLQVEELAVGMWRIFIRLIATSHNTFIYTSINQSISQVGNVSIITKWPFASPMELPNPSQYRVGKNHDF